MSTFLRATRGEDFPSKIKYPTILAIMILIICRITIDINDKYIHFSVANLKNPLKNIVFSIIWILTIISVIYIYPKVEVYATIWYNLESLFVRKLMHILNNFLFRFIIFKKYLI